MDIVFDRVSKQFPNGFTAVRELSLAVASGELLVLLGTSGSGKTTSMKMINRLIDPTGGTILVGGSSILDHNPIELRRQIGYAIQHIGLFPHMTIAENIATVPRLLGWDASRIAERTSELLTMVGLDPDEFRERYPVQLSGGQRQRIGVARALAADPPIVLMDEPFGALDPITREQLQEEFLSLQAELHKTVVFVTHDVFEAVKLADRIALLDEGRLEQLATPAELVENPANGYVENFLGQHRFQLSLLTRQVRSLMDDADTSVPPEFDPKARHLHGIMSMIEALDVFKGARVDLLPVYDRKHQFLGRMRKHDLVTAMAAIIEDPGATA